LTGSGGGYKKDRAAQQIVTRCFKSLRLCCEDEEELTCDVVDFGLCSPNLLFKFIVYLQDECKLGHGGSLGYIDAISEIIDFRKLHGASEAVFRQFSATELYLKRAQDCCKDDEIAVDTRFRHLNTGSKRPLGNNGRIVGGREIPPAALRKYREDLQFESRSSYPSDLTFATKFVAMYLFIKVKGSRPMTYQYLMVDMIATAKEKG